MNTNSCRIDFKRLVDINHQAIRAKGEELEEEAFELVKKHHPQLDREYFSGAFKLNLVSPTLAPLISSAHSRIKELKISDYRTESSCWGTLSSRT